MRLRRARLVAILCALTFLSTLPVPHAEAGCKFCEFVVVPDPSGGPGMNDVVCIDYGENIGWVECIEYNGTCQLFVSCYWLDD